MSDEDSTVKKDGPEPRARKENVAQSLAKIVKKAAQIADLMTGEDVEADLRVLRQAKKATHQIFDTSKKKLVKVPDHKTRLAATTLSRAYHEGKPIERQVQVSGTFDELGDMVAKFKSSPAAQGFWNSLQNTSESEEQPVIEATVTEVKPAE